MKSEILLSILVALMVVAATSTALFHTTPEPTIPYVTVRGEHAVFQGSGLYRWDPVELAREGMLWDGINLAIAVPLLVIAIVMAARGRLRGRIMLAGLLAYFFYVYLQYAMMVAFNPLFLLYVATFALSGVALLITIGRIDVARLPEHLSERFPRKLFVGFSFTFAGALVLLWLARIIPIMISGTFPPELAGLTTLETQAIDLGMLVPLAISAGVLLHRGAPWGYLLSGLVLMFGVMMFISIPVWIVVPLLRQGEMNLVESAPFLILSIVGMALAWIFLRSVREETPAVV